MMEQLSQALAHASIDAVATAKSGLRIVLILAMAWIAIAVVQRAIVQFRRRMEVHLTDRESIQRVQTLGRVFRYTAAVVISLMAGLLVLSELGVSVAPLLGAAGVAGVAIGFGAQSLVKDYFNGFFLLLENQIRQGDVVQLGDHGGLVEQVTLRFVQLRDYDGNVHFVPNGTITSVINMSRGHAQAVVNVGVAYDVDVDQAIQVMQQVADQMRADPQFAARILEPLEVAGVDRLDSSSVVLLARFKTRPLEQWNVKREFLRRVKTAFQEQGIEIPFPHMVVVPKGSAPRA
jgi:small conductance mechanosensitive channel